MAHTEKMRILVWEARHDKKLTLKQLSALSGVSKGVLWDADHERDHGRQRSDNGGLERDRRQG